MFSMEICLEIFSSKIRQVSAPFLCPPSLFMSLSPALLSSTPRLSLLLPTEACEARLSSKSKHRGLKVEKLLKNAAGRLLHRRD